MEITDIICFLLNNNYLSMSQVIIVDKSKYLKTCSNQEIISSHDEVSGDGNTHVALKIIVSEYIGKVHSLDCIFKQPFAGFVPDVQSIDKRIVCECGHTNNPEKIFTYFRHPNVKCVMQIPYLQI
jgi:hypothetical protein